MYTSRLRRDKCPLKRLSSISLYPWAARADGRVAQLVKIPARRVLLPQRVGLAVRQRRVAISGQIRAAWRTCLSRGDKQRAHSGLAALLQVIVQTTRDAA